MVTIVPRSEQRTSEGGHDARNVFWLSAILRSRDQEASTRSLGKSLGTLNADLATVYTERWP